MNEQALQAFFAGEDARRSAQNTLIAEVATEWLSIGADQANLDLARRTLESQTASYSLVEKSYNAGASNRLELNQAKETVATAKIAVQTAIASLEQDQNALRLLVGAEVPADLLPKKIELGATLPATMPAGLPSQVLLRRPDISSAERSLRSANANIGVARAAFFPSITLTSSIGTLSTDMSNLFKGAAARGPLPRRFRSRSLRAARMKRILKRRRSIRKNRSRLTRRLFRRRSAR